MVILVVVYTDWIVKVFLPGSIKPGRWLITIKVLSSKGPPLVTPLMINRYKSIPNHTALVMKMMIMEVLWSFSYCPGPSYQQIKVNTRSVKVENQSKARMVTHEDVGQVFKIKVVFGDSLQHMAINNLNDVWNTLWKSTIPLWQVYHERHVCLYTSF